MERNRKTALEILGLVLIFAVTTACQRSELDTTDVTAAPKTAELEVALLTSARPEASSDVATAPEVELTPPAPLNLNFSIDGMAHSDQSEDIVFDNQATLPDFFNREDKQSRTKSSMRILRDQEDPDLVNSIDGLEVNIERKF